jgi:hypothetical protein
VELAQDTLSAFALAVIVPLSLFVTLLIVRVLSYLWYVSLNRRPLPVVIHDIAAESDPPHATSDSDHERIGCWPMLPSALRDYISADPPLTRQLAPGVAGAASPAIPVAAAGRPPGGWTAALVNLVLPQRQACYNIYLSPHPGEPGLCVSVLLVKTPQQWIEAARTFHDVTLAGLTLQVGGYCMERVRLQPPFLRRAPRWEHWGSRGSYSLFRRALAYQEDREFGQAHEAFEDASALSPGNIRLGVHRASLHELQQHYGEAARLYDALHCLWRQNVEVIYRAAAARVNRAHELLAQRTAPVPQPCGADAVSVPKPRHGGAAADGTAAPADSAADGTAAPADSAAGPADASAYSTGSSPPGELRLTAEAEYLFALTKKNLKLGYMLWRWFKTWLPRRRDIGERRYWLSWLRADTYSQPLMLLRRSKRYEYLSAVKVAIEANRLLTALIGHRLDHPVAPFDADASYSAVIRLIRRKRAGWLAHWTAACYFARAAQASTLLTPREGTWRKHEKRSRAQASLGVPPSTCPRSWRRYCEDTAIAEIGRVLRNPCNQLNPELLHKDPDMRTLDDAFKASTVKILIGRLREGS